MMVAIDGGQDDVGSPDDVWGSDGDDSRTTGHADGSAGTSPNATPPVPPADVTRRQEVPLDRTAPAADEVRQGRTSRGGHAEAGLARQLSELARTLQAEHDADALLRRIVHAAVQEVPGADHAGITLLDKGRLWTVASTDRLVEQVDKLQYDVRQGPCVSASREHATFLSDDLSTEARWPQFGPRAVDIGVRSMLSFQLFVERDSFGALNLYSSRVRGFDGTDENVGLLLASHAAVAMAASRKEADLRVALSTRDVIGQAKGILMERHRITGEAAFHLLVLASQRTNLKLRDVADRLVETGQLQDRPAS